MQWDLGLQGLGLLAAMSIGFGVVGGWIAGRSAVQRGWAVVLVAAACFAVGLLTSEVWFGWATGEDLQPNIDGLSFDEVLLSGVLTTVAAILATRFFTRRGGHHGNDGRHLGGRHHGRPAGVA